ncbi:hypothetical protein DERF_009890 [Dermatophagoides farinae]|uniref:Uncharacterized protein n=1 Tax=Dermatophagoides farinae TaxID=6954 RepID=A0A922HXA4_DERFA|nr:hypothetical protein DERF_009890 [Dermatophagoides farinae]
MNFYCFTPNPGHHTVTDEHIPHRQTTTMKPSSPQGGSRKRPRPSVPVYHIMNHFSTPYRMLKQNGDNLISVGMPGDRDDWLSHGFLGHSHDTGHPAFESRYTIEAASITGLAPDVAPTKLAHLHKQTQLRHLHAP